MYLPLDKIPDDGLSLSFDDVEPWTLTAASQATEGEVQRVDGSLDIRRFGDHIRITGELSAEVRRPCDRCMEQGRITIGGPVNLSYVPRSRLVDAATDLSESDLDLGFYEGGVLDLDAVVREHFALAMPYRLTCDVSGFVLEGSDGAVQPCSPPAAEEAHREPDPRFASLKGLKLED